MEITLFGFVWICVLLYALSKPKKLPFILLVSMSLQCVDCLRIAEIGIGPHIITCCMYLVTSFKTKISVVKKNWFFLFGLTLFATIMLSLRVNGLLQYASFFKAIQFLIYLLTANSLLKSNNLDKNETKSILDALMFFLLGMGVVQVLMTLNIIPKFWLFEQLFYNNTDNVAFYNKNYYRICSTFMEPSYYAPFLCAMFFLYYKGNNKKDRLISGAILLEIVLTFSTTAYVAMVISFIIYLISDMYATKAIKVKDVVFIGCGVLGIVALMVGTDILEEVVFKKMSSISATVRNQWNNRAIESFYSSPLIGVGYKQSRASSIINCLLGELGIIGLITYFLMLVGLIRRIQRESGRFVYIVMIVCVSICQVIAIPDIDLSSVWLVIYVACLLTTSDKNSVYGKSAI